MSSPNADHPNIEWRKITSQCAVNLDDGNHRLLTHISHRAMATDFVAILPDENPAHIELTVDALEELNRIESKLTVYQPESEISQVNRFAAKHPVAVSWSTFQLLGRAIEWSRRTEGAFDITAGPLVDAWGFSKREGRKPTRTEVETARQRVGYHKIQLDSAKQTVHFTEAGMAINLGAIGKGFALDRIAGQLKERGVVDFLLHGGNSSVIASGNQVENDQRGWAIGLAHPTKPGHRLTGLWLKDQALGTSGSGKQFFHHRGRRYGHVIDPRSGFPAGDLQSLTTIPDSATDADACATGLFVAGSNAVSQWSSKEWFQPTIMVRNGARQDASEIGCIGKVQWVRSPTNEERNG